jgi:YD repeat-containing protein
MLALCVLAFCLPQRLVEAATTQYVYDELGRLVQATRSDGAVIQYQYDANGNLLAVNRINAGGLAIATFAPSITHATATVIISGTGFSATPAANTVTVGGASATVTAATPTQLTISVPMAAQSGFISVTVDNSTATSAQQIVIRRPGIQSFSPGIVNAGATVSLTGSYLNLIPGTTSFSTGSVAASTSTLSNTSASIVVGANGSGRVNVQTAYGNGQSAGDLYVLPAAVSASTIDSAGTALIDGVAASLNINAPLRSAVLAFDGITGQRLSVQLDSYLPVPASVNTSYKFYSPTGSQLKTGSVTASNKTIHLPTLASTGRYLVVFTTSSSGTAQLSARVELVPNLDTTGVVQPILTAVAGQSKQVRFFANAGDTVSIAGYNLVTNPTSVSNVEVTVNDPTADQVDFFRVYRTHNPGDQATEVNLPETGDYAIYLTPDSSAAMSMNFRVVKQTAVPLSAGTSASFNLATPGDIAWANFTSTGATYALNSTSIVTTPAGKTVRLEVYDSAGTRIANSSTNGSSTTINLKNLAAGTYHVGLAPVDAATATLQLRLANGLVGTVPADGTIMDYAASLPGQAGYFTFSGTAGQNLSFTSTNVTLAPAAGAVAYTIRRPGGSQLYFGYGYRTNTPGDQKTLINLPDSGTYSITAEPTEHSQMAFKLRLSPPVTGTVTPGAPAQNLNLSVQGDVAWLQFTNGAVQNVTVNVTSIVTSPANKSVRVEVINASGTVVGSNSGTGATRTVNLTNLPIGTYSIHIAPSSGATATMQVRIP